jgi:sRNA-binding regulator protein Hfq
MTTQVFEIEGSSLICSIFLLERKNVLIFLINGMEAHGLLEAIKP